MRTHFQLSVIIVLIILAHAIGIANAKYDLRTVQTPQASNCLSKTFILDLALSPDGKKLLAVPEKIHAVWLWDIENGKKIWSYRNEEASASEITSIAFSPNGKYFLISDLDRAIVWDSTTFAQIGIFPRPKRMYTYTKAIFLPDSEHILVSGDSDGVQLWEIASQKLIRSFPGVTRAILSPDGNHILVIPNYDKNQTTWDLWNIWEGRRLHNFPVVIVPHFSPDSKWVSTDDQKNGLIMTSIQNPNITHFVFPPRDWAYGLQFSLDSKFVLMGDGTGADILVEVATGKVVHTFTDITGSYFYFRNNTLLSVGMASDSNTTTKVRVWNLANFSLVTDTVIDTSEASFYNFNFSDDGKYLLTNSDTKGYLLWDMDTLNVISHFC